MPDFRLSNEDRTVILAAVNNFTSQYLKDQEIYHFGSTARSEMRAKFSELVTPIGSFDNAYDDYLIALRDQDVDGAGGPGSPIGLLIALTQA